MVYDSDSFATSLSNNATSTLTVAADGADYVYVTVDDGTSGNTPSQYTITVDKYTHSLGGASRTQFVWEETGRTDRSWRFEAAGHKMDITIKNTSGGAATFEAEAESRQSNI